jgi:AcrR family transcriptional regulator
MKGTMTPITDRRVRRTRAALLDALLALMVEKGYEAVTVQDLIDRADIGRSTFYAHFTDKSDLLHEALAGLRAIIEPAPDAPHPDRRRPLRFSRRMFHHVRDQQPLLTALLGHPGTNQVIAEIERMLLDIVQAELETFAGSPATVHIPLDLLARSVVASYLAALTWWVANDFRQTPDEMEILFQSIVAPGIRAAIPAHPTRASGLGR